MATHTILGGLSASFQGNCGLATDIFGQLSLLDSGHLSALHFTEPEDNGPGCASGGGPWGGPA